MRKIQINLKWQNSYDFLSNMPFYVSFNYKEPQSESVFRKDEETKEDGVDKVYTCNFPLLPGLFHYNGEEIKDGAAISFLSLLQLVVGMQNLCRELPCNQGGSDEDFSVKEGAGENKGCIELALPLLENREGEWSYADLLEVYSGGSRLDKKYCEKVKVKTVFIKNDAKLKFQYISKELAGGSY